MALVLTHPLTEMNIRNISWSKVGRSVGLTTLPHSCTTTLKSGSLNLLEPSESVQACNGIAFLTVLGLFLPLLLSHRSILLLIC